MSYGFVFFLFFAVILIGGGLTLVVSVARKLEDNPSDIPSDDGDLQPIVWAFDEVPVVYFSGMREGKYLTARSARRMENGNFEIITEYSGRLVKSKNRVFCGGASA